MIHTEQQQDADAKANKLGRLERGGGVRLFVKQPGWFKIETPIGTYNPDWAIFKQDNIVIYMVRETKGTKNFEKLRNIEAEKIHCGRRHFEALGGGISFDVVTGSDEVWLWGIWPDQSGNFTIRSAHSSGSVAAQIRMRASMAAAAWTLCGIMISPGQGLFHCRKAAKCRGMVRTSWVTKMRPS